MGARHRATSCDVLGETLLKQLPEGTAVRNLWDGDRGVGPRGGVEQGSRTITARMGPMEHRATRPKLS